METYIGVKVVKAVEMDYNTAIEKGYRVSDTLATTGYEVEYEDGYKSWSPKEVFDKAYRKTNGLTFGLALEALKQGRKVAREGWNGKNMWLKIVNHYEVNEDLAEVWHRKEGSPTPLLPWLGMKTADNKFVPWLASQTDLLAEDWVILFSEQVG